MSRAPFRRLAELSEQLEGESRRGELTSLLAGYLRELAAEELPAAVRLTIGQVFPEWDSRTLNVSWKSLMAVVDDLAVTSPQVRKQVWAQAEDGGQAVRLLFEQGQRHPSAASGTAPPPTILDVYGALEAIAAAKGRGSKARKSELLRALFERASPVEAKTLAKVILQDMRHGVSEGIMLAAIAKASGIRLGIVSRANQLWGDLGEVALTALTQGEAPLRSATVRLFRPLKPMLAQTAESLAEAFERLGDRLALEHKLDGARVQIHRQGEKVRIYSRNLADVSSSLPDVVSDVQSKLRASEAVLDAEAIAVDNQGRPLPFQHLMRRFRRKHAIREIVAEVPVQLHLFDILSCDGQSLIDMPSRDRWSVLERAAGGLSLVRRLVPSTLEEGQAFAEEARRDGHEGLMAKDLDSLYSPGARGKAWLKLKHVMSLDLVVIAADWGYGRRHGWLSNYHLAALDTESGHYRLVGKTFKGLTDSEFQQMTQRLLALERSRQGATVFVEPSVVVEVLFNEIQESSQYESGLALRFARITRIRDDKRPDQADTLETLRMLYDRQFQFKGHPE